MFKTFLFSFLTLLSITIYAQDLQPTGARSVATISSLMGKSIDQAKTLLSKYNLESKEFQADDPDLKIDVYPFYPKGIKESDKRDEPQYYLGCKNNKILFVTLAFEPEEEDDAKKIINSLKTQFVNSGFTIEKNRNQSFTKNGGMGSKVLKEVYWHKNAQTNLASFLLNDDNSVLLLSLGDTKYINMIFEINKNDFGFE